MPFCGHPTGWRLGGGCPRFDLFAFWEAKSPPPRLCSQSTPPQKNYRLKLKGPPPVAGMKTNPKISPRSAARTPKRTPARKARGQAAARPRRTGLFPPGVSPDDAGYSPGIVAEGRRLIVVSGQGPADLDADTETQVRQTFERIGKVLAAAGGSFEDIVMIRSYFVKLARDLPAYRKVRKEFLSPPYPASTAVGVSELAIPGLQLEIEAVALL